MHDRQSTKPGRILITPEDGSAPFYATVTRADDPTDLGTPYNKATQLTDATAALLALAQEDPTVNDALNKIGRALQNVPSLDDGGLLPTSVLPTIPADKLPSIPTDKLPTVPVSKGGTGKTAWTANGLLYASAAATLAQLAHPTVDGAVLRQGKSGAPYWTSPQDLVTALGAAGGVRIQAGKYEGTVTYGATAPCSITFDFEPKLVFVYDPRFYSYLFGSPGNAASFSNEYVAQMIMAVYGSAGMRRAGFMASNTAVTWITDTFIWDGNTFKWYSQVSYYTPDGIIQLNYLGQEYSYVAIG